MSAARAYLRRCRCTCSHADEDQLAEARLLTCRPTRTRRRSARRCRRPATAMGTLVAVIVIGVLIWFRPVDRLSDRLQVDRVCAGNRVSRAVEVQRQRSVRGEVVGHVQIRGRRRERQHVATAGVWAGTSSPRWPNYRLRFLVQPMAGAALAFGARHHPQREERGRGYDSERLDDVDASCTEPPWRCGWTTLFGG